MILNVHTNSGKYPIYIERGILERICELISVKNRRICIVTDSGVPKQYVQTLASQCTNPFIYCFPSGEQHKNFDTLRILLGDLLKNHFDRKDAIIAVGGGVVTDLAGFAAAIYMRGIDFYNIPTTLLAQVDASVGGKTAIDFDGYKNMIGAFWQPKAVLIDPLTLNTLPRRRVSDGLAEVIKMALTCDADLFKYLEEFDYSFIGDGSIDLPKAFDEMIIGALRIKIGVVENDVYEAGVRRVLNFGHTLGHAIESCGGFTERYHGECVALGMLPMCSDEVRTRLLPLLKHSGLPYTLERLPAYETLLTALRHDKKAAGEVIQTIYVPHVGEFAMQEQTSSELIKLLQQTETKLRS